MSQVSGEAAPPPHPHGIPPQPGSQQAAGVGGPAVTHGLPSLEPGRLVTPSSQLNIPKAHNHVSYVSYVS